MRKIIVDDLYAGRSARFYEKTAPTLRSERFGLKVVRINECSICKQEILELHEERGGYLPQMFNPYNQCDISKSGLCPTLSTQCGSVTSSATVLILEVKRNDE